MHSFNVLQRPLRIRLDAGMQSLKRLEPGRFFGFKPVAFGLVPNVSAKRSGKVPDRAKFLIQPWP